MSIATQLAGIRQLRSGGKTGQYVTEARALADRERAHVGAQLEAAYACDRVGEDHLAADYYARARRLGVPDDQHAHFAVGYGSTLFELGKNDEAIALLGEGLVRHPDYPPIKAYLAVALHRGKYHHAAMATLLELVLEVADKEDLDRFRSDLEDIQTELTTASLEQA